MLCSRSIYAYCSSGPNSDFDVTRFIQSKRTVSIRRIERATGGDPGKPEEESPVNLNERKDKTMKRTLIALALALGATAAVAEPTLSTAQNDIRFKSIPEATTYQSQAQLVDDNAPGYPFNP
jgi:hypothetical protein